MSLLSDKEMRLIAGPRVDYFDHGVFGRAIEAALLAKLAAKELPEPAMLTHGPIDTTVKSWFTADQQRQAYAQGFAQGAASQLSSEPVGFVAPHDLKTLSEGYPATVVMLSGHKRTEPLYTRKEDK